MFVLAVLTQKLILHAKNARASNVRTLEQDWGNTCVNELTAPSDRTQTLFTLAFDLESLQRLNNEGCD